MSLRASVVLGLAVLAVALVYIFGRAAGAPADASPLLANVGGYRITVNEFKDGFMTSAFAARADRLQARREYLETLIDQKLILLDAQKHNLDKTPDFLRSVERFWSQSLLTVALGSKTLEFHKGSNVKDEDVRRIYDDMVKDGVTTKPIQEVYSQIKWQAEKQVESQKLNAWIASLRKAASVRVDEMMLKSLK
ncbi:MAG: hypothetical protein V2A70_04395 [Candidatus Omnitrophota bacterium]